MATTRKKKKKKIQKISVGEDMKKLEPLCTATGGIIKRRSCHGKHLEVPQKIKIELPRDPAIPLLGTEPANGR